MPYQLFYGQPFMPGAGAGLFEGAQRATDFARGVENIRLGFQRQALALQRTQLALQKRAQDLERERFQEDLAQRAEQFRQNLELQRGHLQLSGQQLQQAAQNFDRNLQLQRDQLGQGATQFAESQRRLATQFDQNLQFQRDQLAETKRQHDLTAQAGGARAAAQQWEEYADRQRGNLETEIASINQDMNVAEKANAQTDKEIARWQAAAKAQYAPDAKKREALARIRELEDRKASYADLQAKRDLRVMQTQFWTQLRATPSSWAPLWAFPQYAGRAVDEGLLRMSLRTAANFDAADPALRAAARANAARIDNLFRTR